MANYRIKLYYFKCEEFEDAAGGWFPLMSPRLLVLADVLRYRWGRPIRISPKRKLTLILQQKRCKAVSYRLEFLTLDHLGT